MSKINRECLTKSERKVLHLIMRNTLHKNTPLKREKRTFKMTNEEMALDISCNERTIQRAIKKFITIGLLSRNPTPKKFWKGAHFLVIAKDFYEQTKDFFEAEKNVTSGEKNVGPILINNNKTISLSLNNSSKKTNTNINRDSVQFFISDEILGIDLHGLDEKIDLTHSDLQRIQNKAKWSTREIQESVSNFAYALDTGLFVAKTTPKIAFISILGGTNKRLPSMFNKIVVSKNESHDKGKELEAATLKAKESVEVKTSQDNYWLSLSDLKRQEYLTSARNNLQTAITLAYTDYIQRDSEFSLTALLANLGNFQFEDNAPKGERNSKIKFKLE